MLRVPEVGCADAILHVLPYVDDWQWEQMHAKVLVAAKQMSYDTTDPSKSSLINNMLHEMARFWRR